MEAGPQRVKEKRKYLLYKLSAQKHDKLTYADIEFGISCYFVILKRFFLCCSVFFGGSLCLSISIIR